MVGLQDVEAGSWLHLSAEVEFQSQFRFELVIQPTQAGTTKEWA